MIKEAIHKVVDRIDLEEEEMIRVMEEIMTGEATQAQIGAFITALRMKGETIDEIVGAAKVMREMATKIPIEGVTLDLDRDDINIDRETIIDTCGTGGDGTLTFNISTATAFVVAGGGITVAKHGNRSVSSVCGSADVLKELGVNIDASPEVVAKCIKKIGIGFLFAPTFHGAMKYAIGPRREIGIRTIFNILGPLTNPANAKYQILGVYKEELCETLAYVLQKLGTKRAMVVHGMDGMDEITVTKDTFVAELKNNQVKTYYLNPTHFNMPIYNFSELRGGNAIDNANIIRDILSGKERGAKRAVVVLNAGCAFYVAEKASTIKEGIEYAEKVIDSGKALEKLEKLIKMSNE
ncbi:MAG: anthranilate phosphoribosyltransferase [Proteobacteria bacterium]|nr:anthranilate phosphoribosyltransferase [Pseudomonadota bacterium]